MATQDTPLSTNEPEIEIKETTPYVEIPEYIEKIEYPVIEDVKELILVVSDENIFNLETVPDYLSGIKETHWLRQQPSDAYTLQLISAQYESNLRKLLSGQSGIQDQLSGYVKYTP